MCVTSWYPKSYGSYFGGPTSSIAQNELLGGNFMENMVYANRPVGTMLCVLLYIEPKGACKVLCCRNAARLSTTGICSESGDPHDFFS